MAIPLRHLPATTPAERRRAKLRVVPEPSRALGSGRHPRLVNVHPSSDDDGTWTCNCICGWNSKRLRFADSDAATRAGELHLRICKLIRR
jgi:hypothetical protein